MAEGPKRAPGRWLVPPSNGAPTITTSAAAREASSSRSARGTPRKVTGGPYMANTAASPAQAVTRSARRPRST